MYIYSFEKLEVWQLARILRREVYSLTSLFPKNEMFGLSSQIRRSASSIGDCIAEGSGRISNKDNARFVVMAYASAVETINHLIGALDLNYISEDQYYEMRKRLESITFKLNSLRNYLIRPDV